MAEQVVKQQETTARGCRTYGILALCPEFTKPDGVPQCARMCEHPHPETLRLSRIDEHSPWLLV